MTSVDCDPAAFTLRVCGWLVPDVRRHLFFLAWACTVPVHVRYVIHLLRLSAVYTEMAEESPTGHVSEAALRSAAADILFGCVAADCRDANVKVRSAHLLPPGDLWAEPCAIAFAGNGGVRVMADGRDTPRAEVLALVAAGDSPAALRAAYLTGLEQARGVERLHALPAAVAPGAPSPAQPVSRARRGGSIANSHGGHGGIHNDVIVLESDGEVDVMGTCEKEVVVLTDSSEDSSAGRKRKRQCRSVDKYEVVE